MSKKSDNFLLVGDIGGTNSNFGLFEFLDSDWHLICSFHFKSKQIDDFTRIVSELVAHINKMHQITIKHLCIAAAGPVSPARDYCTLTNAPISIDAKALKKALNLNCIAITNDFEVIEYGINRITPEYLIQIYTGQMRDRANKVIIGAGTGLGASIVYWDCGKKRYSPVMSEGGHSDCSVQNKTEYELLEFIQHSENRSCNISWEDILSGAGIKRMYSFFRARDSAAPSYWRLGNDGPQPDEIFQSKDLDAYAQATYQLYTKMYARFAKYAALTALSLGGLYIAGGIAAHNVSLFESEIFITEFLNCCKQQSLLRTIPIFVIADYNVSLYGAAEYMRLEDSCMKVCI